MDVMLNMANEQSPELNDAVSYSHDQWLHWH